MSRRLRKERVDKPVSDASAPTAISPRVYLIAIVVAIAAFATFLPALDNDFNYDDDEIILRNDNFRGFAPENVQWMFTTFHMGHYQPVTWLSLAADYSLWEMNPRGYRRPIPPGADAPRREGLPSTPRDRCLWSPTWR